jgi:hypothetical protein
MRNGFQVVWIAAAPILAKMINIQTVRYPAFGQLIGDTMNCDTPSTRGKEAVPIRILAGVPLPAFAFLLVYLCPKLALVDNIRDAPSAPAL